MSGAALIVMQNAKPAQKPPAQKREPKTPPAERKPMPQRDGLAKFAKGIKVV